MKRTEAGSGGKLGHSNMAHWSETEWVKRVSKKLRRKNDKEAVRED